MISDVTVSNGVKHLISCICSALFKSGSASNLIASLISITALAMKRSDKSALVGFCQFFSEVAKIHGFQRLLAPRNNPILGSALGLAILDFEADVLRDGPSCRRLNCEGLFLGRDNVRLETNETQYLQLFDEVTDEKSIGILGPAASAVQPGFSFSGNAFLFQDGLST